MNSITEADRANLLDGLWDLDQPEQVESRYRELLSRLPALPDTDSSFRAELLTQLARAQALQAKFDAAKETLAKASALLDHSTGTYRVSAKIRLLMEEGRLHVLEKTPSQARPLFQQAWNLANHSQETFHAVDAARMIALIEAPKSQREWLQRALILAEESQEIRVRRLLGSIYLALGEMQFELRQFSQALELFEKAVRSFRSDGTPDRIIGARNAWGRTLRSLHRITEALELQQELLEELNQAQVKNGRVHEEIAECLQLQGKTLQAQTHFALAYESLSQDPWFVDNEPTRLKRMKDLGKVKA